MPADRIKEIVDFATTESPYRSANKGWVADDIFLEWGSNRREPSKKFDQIASVSVYWTPIFQIISVLFVVVSLATFISFTPIYLSHNSASSVISLSKLAQTTSEPVLREEQAETIKSEEKQNTNLSSPQASSVAENIIISSDNKNNPLSSVPIDKAPEKKGVEVDRTNTSQNLSKSITYNPPAIKQRKVVTATDLFQSRRS